MVADVTDARCDSVHLFAMDDELELLESMYPGGDGVTLLKEGCCGTNEKGSYALKLTLRVELNFVLVDVVVRVPEGYGCENESSEKHPEGSADESLGNDLLPVEISIGKCRGVGESQTNALLRRARSDCRDACGEWCVVAIFGAAIDFLRDVEENHKLECGICLHAMKPSKIVRTPCFHLFHKTCLAAWHVRVSSAAAQKREKVEAEAASRQALQNIEGQLQQKRAACRNYLETMHRFDAAMERLTDFLCVQGRQKRNRKKEADMDEWCPELSDGLSEKEVRTQLRNLESAKASVASDLDKASAKAAEIESKLSAEQAQRQQSAAENQSAVSDLECPVCRQMIHRSFFKPFLDAEKKRLVNALPPRWSKESLKSASVKTLPENMRRQVKAFQRKCEALRKHNAKPKLVIENANVRAVILPYGATLAEVHVPDRNGVAGNVVLGMDDWQSSAKNPCMNCVIGRVAGRTAPSIEIDGVSYELPGCDGGGGGIKATTCLHGGMSWNTATWRVVERGDAFVTLEHFEAAGPFPGDLTARVTYSVECSTLKISYEATCTSTTPISLTNHAYWNLSAGTDETVERHTLQLLSDAYRPDDGSGDGLPTGERKLVQGTARDAREGVNLGEFIAAQAALSPHWPHGEEFEVTANRHKKHDDESAPALAAVLSHDETGRRMAVYTTEPALQTYYSTLLMPPHARYGAVCLEAQRHANAERKSAAIPSRLVCPGETYRQTTAHVFSTFSCR